MPDIRSYFARNGCAGTKGPEAQPAKAAEDEARGKKRTAGDGFGDSRRPKPFRPEQMAGAAGGQPLAPLANGCNGSASPRGPPQEKPRHGRPTAQSTNGGILASIPEGAECETPGLMDRDDEDDFVEDPSRWVPAKQPADEEDGISGAPPAAQQPDGAVGDMIVDRYRFNALKHTHDKGDKAALVRKHCAGSSRRYTDATQRNANYAKMQAKPWMFRRLTQQDLLDLTRQQRYEKLYEDRMQASHTGKIVLFADAVTRDKRAAEIGERLRSTESESLSPKERNNLLLLKAACEYNGEATYQMPHGFIGLQSWAVGFATWHGANPDVPVAEGELLTWHYFGVLNLASQYRAKQRKANGEVVAPAHAGLGILFDCCVRHESGCWVLQERYKDSADARLSVRVANRLQTATKVAQAGMPSVERYRGVDEHRHKLTSRHETNDSIRERYGHFLTMVNLVASVQLELYDKDPQNVFAIDPGCDLAADLGKQGDQRSARVFHHCWMTGIHICICLQHINNCIGGVRVMLMMMQLLRGVIDRWAEFAKEKPALAAAMASDGKHWGTTFEGSPYPGVTAYFEAPSESAFPASPKLAEIDASVDGATKFKRELVGGRMCKGRDYGLVTLARLLKGVSGASVLGANGARKHTGLAAFVGNQLSLLTTQAGGRGSESTATRCREGAMRFFQFYMLKAGDDPDEFGAEVEKDFQRCLAAQKLPEYQGAEFNKGMCEDVTALNYATEHRMAIDHSHETGEIRCITKCNNGLLGLGCIGYLRYLLAAGRTRGS